MAEQRYRHAGRDGAAHDAGTIVVGSGWRQELNGGAEHINGLGIAQIDEMRGGFVISEVSPFDLSIRQRPA